VSEDLARVEVLPPGKRPDFIEQRRQAEVLKLAAAGLRITDLETEGAANELLLKVKKLYRDMATAFHSIVDPLELSKRNTKALFDPPMGALSGVEKVIKTTIGDWKLAEKRRIEAAQRKALEEAARVQREIADKKYADAKAAADKARKEAEEEARAAGNLTPEEAKEYASQAATEAQEGVLDRPTPTVKAKPVEAQERSYSGDGGRSNVRFEYDYEVESLGQLQAACPELVEVSVRRRAVLDRLKATNGKAIPGLKVVEKPIVSGTI
jgi:hypothetical protein